jgi:hypothetical protein
MKTWSLMYLMIWVGLIQILLVLPPIAGSVETYVHGAVGVVVLVLSYSVFSRIRATSCPNRIKLITKTTFGLAALQAVLGISLFAVRDLSSLGLANSALTFFHAANAIAIITQASSSATAYDMWEEKEFSQGLSAPDGQLIRGQ